VTEPEETEPDRLLDVELPTAFRGLDPDAVHALLEEAVARLRTSQERERELREAVAGLEAELAEARADATAELEEAKRKGRELVIEAQTVRRRILEDLARRRRSLRRQIEQLRAGRERLLEAYEVVGHTVEEATQELNVALPAAKAAAERAERRSIPEDTVEDLEEEIEAARVADLPILDDPSEDPADPAAAAAPEDAPAALSEVEPVVASFEEVRVLGPVDHEEAAEAAPPIEEEPAEVLQLFDRLRTESDEPETESEVEAPAEVEDPELVLVPDEPAAGDEVEEDEPVEEDPVAVLADDLSRRLRRSLADEQNQVLDRLRQDRKGELGVDDLLGDPDALVARLATVIEPRLAEAGGNDEPGGAAELASRLAAQVADGVRAEVDARVTGDPGPDDLSKPLREAFREWRTDRILPLAVGVAAEAMGRG
jgi:cell division septum initiation protein DivIVA